MTTTLLKEDRYENLFPDIVSGDIGQCVCDLLAACGVQGVGRIYHEVGTQVFGFLDSKVVEMTNSAIAVLLDNHLIEKWEYQEDDGTMADYYDLPEDDGDEI